MNVLNNEQFIVLNRKQTAKKQLVSKNKLEWIKRQNHNRQGSNCGKVR